LEGRVQEIISMPKKNEMAAVMKARLDEYSTQIDALQRQARRPQGVPQQDQEHLDALRAKRDRTERSSRETQGVCEDSWGRVRYGALWGMGRR
jgi:hypothetical protein